MASLNRQLVEAEEQLLVVSAQCGGRDAFRQLIERYERRLLYFIRRLLGDAEGSLDILQDVWLTVHRNLGKLQASSAFRSWLYQIAHGRTVDLLRRSRRERELVGALSEDSLIDPVDEEEERFEAVDAEMIHQAMQRLAAPHREALTLHFLENMSVEEMATVAGRPAGTMKSRLYHAKRLLRDILEKSHHAEVRTGQSE